MVGERAVSPSFPPSRTLCPASPSLQWVPWASVPHLLGLRLSPATPRYYAPLRLPPCLSRAASLVARVPATLPAPLVRGVRFRLVTRWKPPSHARAFRSAGPPVRHFYKEAGGSPKFPSNPSEYMPRSQTPVVSGTLAHHAPRIAACRRMATVGFPLTAAWRVILMTTTLHSSGAPSRGLPPRDTRLRSSLTGLHAGSRLTGGLGARQVGLEP